MDEEALVRAARKGDREAYGTLVERYARAVTARAFACTRELASAEDLAQEAFLRGWQGLARLEDARSFGSWILSIAGFTCQEWIRRKQTAEKHRFQVARPAASKPPEEPDLPLAEAVAELPPEVQQILALRHGAGRSCEDIARELDKPLGTVTKTLSRAYAQLRERLVRK